MAERLTRLYELAQNSDGRRLSDSRVADEIRQRYGDVGLSRQHFNQLRTGERDNPTRRVLEALAGYFGVPVAYLLDEDEAIAGRIDEQLELVEKLRDAGLMSVAGRLSTLSQQSRDAVINIIEQFVELEQRTQ